jgi:hypothetical protein
MKIKNSVLFLLIIFFIPFPGASQEMDDDSKSKWNKYLQIGAGVSRFYMHNNPEAVQYPTYEMSLRYSVERQLFKRTFLLTGFNYTEKFKRPSYYFITEWGHRATRESTALPHFDFAASDANRRALSIPLQVRWKFSDERLHLDVGGLFRSWLPYKRENLEPNWVLNGLLEAGLLIRVEKRMLNHIYLGAEAYSGLTAIDGSVVITGSNPSTPILPNIVNQYAQLTLSYKLGR